MKKFVSIVAIMLLWVGSIYAGGTTAGTSIDNNATLSYSTGGTAQPDVHSNVDSFVVDKKVDMVLVTTDTDQQTGPLGKQDVITHFSFTNEGNAKQKFRFSVRNLVNNEVADYDSDKDNNNVNNLEFDCKSSGTWTAEGSTVVIEVDIGENFTCQARADIPDSANASNGDIMNIELIAEAVQSDGSTHESNTSGADTQGSVDVVLADGTSHSSLGNGSNGKGDSPQDGNETARSGYIVGSPVLDLTKLSCVYSDPVNGTTNPKRIPAATILYVFDINNTGSLDATDITLTDTLQSDLDGGSVTNVKTDENTSVTPCSCSDGNHYAMSSGGHAGTNTNTGSGQDVKVEHIDVGQGKHTCVSFEVKIK